MRVVDPVLRLGPGGVLNRATIVVTGGAGFIGSHVVERLLMAGATVKVIDDISSGRLDNLRDAFESGLTDADIHICDIRSPDAAGAVRRWRPDVLVHLAAQPSLPAAVRSPLADADINIRGTVNLLDGFADGRAGLVVYAASCAVYGEVAGTMLPVVETAPIAPTSPYGLSKATALKYLDWYRDHRGVSYTALVLGNVYGPRQTGPNAGVVGRMVHALATGAEPVVFGDGEQTRDFVCVGDVAEAVTAACARAGLGLVNVASGTETTVSEIARLVARSIGVAREPRHTEPLAADVRRMVLDVSRAAAVLGWRATTPLAQGVRATVRAARTTTRAKEAS